MLIALVPLFEAQPLVRSAFLVCVLPWCAQGAAIENNSVFVSLYEQQYEAPVFHCPSIGAVEFQGAHGQ
jgi:hypothetical protein